MAGDLVFLALYGAALFILAFASIDGCRIIFRGVRDYLARSDGQYRFLIGIAGVATAVVAFFSGVAVVVSIVGWIAHGLRPWRTGPYRKADTSLYPETGYPKRTPPQD